MLVFNKLLHRMKRTYTVTEVEEIVDVVKGITKMEDAPSYVHEYMKYYRLRESVLAFLKEKEIVDEYMGSLSDEEC